SGRSGVDGQPHGAVVVVCGGRRLGDVGQVLLTTRVTQHDRFVTGLQGGGEHALGDLADGYVSHGQVALGGEDVGDRAGGHGIQRVMCEFGVLEGDPVEQLYTVLGDASGTGKCGGEQHTHAGIDGDPFPDGGVGGFHFCSDVATQGTVGALDHQPHRPHGFHHVRHQIGGLFGGHVTAVQVGHDHVVVPHDTTDVFWGHGGHTHPGPGEPGTGGVGTGEVVCDHEDLGQDLAPSPDLAIDLSPR